MHKTFILGMMTALAGCAAPPPGFAGTWVGMATQSVQICSDGTKGAAQSGPYGAQITETGTTLSFPIACGTTVTFDVDPPDATQPGTATCPAKSASGSTAVVVFSNGSLTLSGDVLRISFDGEADISGMLNGTCTFTVEGLLDRQP